MTYILEYPIERLKLYGSVNVYRLGVGGFNSLLLLPPTNDLEWSTDHILELETSTGHLENVSSP